MITEAKIDFARYDKTLYDKSDFDCGDPFLNEYILKYAGQQQKKHITTVYVCSLQRAKIPRYILGYYTLSANSFSVSEFPKTLLNNFPENYRIPTIKIGRLARDINKTRPGFGVVILGNALHRALRMSDFIGALAIDVDAKNNRLVNFYLKQGFIRLNEESSCLVMPVSTLAKIMQYSNEYAEMF